MHCRLYLNDALTSKVEAYHSCLCNMVLMQRQHQLCEVVAVGAVAFLLTEFWTERGANHIVYHKAAVIRVRFGNSAMV